MGKSLSTVVVGGILLGGSAIACASGSHSTTYELAPAPVVERTNGGCASAQQPQQLPSAAMVVDSAALMAFIRAIPVESADVTLSIVFRGDGAVPQTAVREGRELAEVADRVLRGVDSLLLAPPRSGSPWGIRFIVTPGKPGRLQVARAEYCPPVAEVAELRSETRTVQVSAADVARMEAEAREFQRRWQQMQEYVGRAWVSAAGRVMAVELVRSSGDVAADREAERMVRRSRFAAARIDGIAVYGWWTGNPVPRLPVE